MAASASMGATALSVLRPPIADRAMFLCPIPNCQSFSPAPWKQLKKSRKPSHNVVKSSSSDETPVDANEVLTDLKERWDAIENKPALILYTSGAIVAVWLASTLVGAINKVPVLPKFMELIGLGYSGWFIYRYLLFKSSRKELATDLELLKKKITGTE